MGSAFDAEFARVCSLLDSEAQRGALSALYDLLKHGPTPLAHIQTKEAAAAFVALKTGACARVCVEARAHVCVCVCVCDLCVCRGMGVGMYVTFSDWMPMCRI